MKAAVCMGSQTQTSTSTLDSFEVGGTFSAGQGWRADKTHVDSGVFEESNILFGLSLNEKCILVILVFYILTSSKPNYNLPGGLVIPNLPTHSD